MVLVEAMTAVVATVALVTGFLSGLLGIGGGIVMAPLLLYVPQMVGLAPLPMRAVAGLTVVQGLVACVAGTLVHRRFHAVSGRLVLWTGPVIFVCALVGGSAAARVANHWLLLVFAVLALTAAVLILFPMGREEEHPDAGMVSFRRRRAMTVAGGVGLLGGLVGQGGSFILIPLLTAWVRIPTRIAVGSNLAIVFLATLAAGTGKALTGQIPWGLALPIVLAVPPATWFGGLVSHRLPVACLRRILAVAIGIAALRISASALAAMGGLS